MDENGSEVVEHTTPTDPEYLATFFKELNLPLEKIGVETGMLSGWLVKELRPKGFNVVCICSRVMNTLLSININKTDENDAKGIADAIRTNKYREVHVKSDNAVGAAFPSNEAVNFSRVLSLPQWIIL